MPFVGVHLAQLCPQHARAPSAAAVAAAAALAAVRPGAGARRAGHRRTPRPGHRRRRHAGSRVLRTGLDVSLLGGGVDVPLDVTLDDVQRARRRRARPRSPRGSTGSTAAGRSVLRATVATARATADSHRAQGYANLVERRGSTCPGCSGRCCTVQAGHLAATWTRPDADRRRVHVLGTVGVLGRAGDASRAGGTADVAGRRAWATSASRCRRPRGPPPPPRPPLCASPVAVDPLGLAVATVKGDITLVRATCETAPGHPGGGSSTGGTSNGGASNGGASNGGSVQRRFGQRRARRAAASGCRGLGVRHRGAAQRPRSSSGSASGSTFELTGANDLRSTAGSTSGRRRARRPAPRRVPPGRRPAHGGSTARAAPAWVHVGATAGWRSGGSAGRAGRPGVRRQRLDGGYRRGTAVGGR